MRHYLNTTLKGKQDRTGQNYYSVYFMFTVNRQTFKIKSRIFNKLVTEIEFQHVIDSHNMLLSKDQEIIDYCIQRSVNAGFINIDQFKSLYTKHCTSIIIWFEDLIRNERGRILDDFFYGADVEGTDSNDFLNKLERKYSIDRRTVLNYFNQYAVYNQESFNRYIIVYDWCQSGIRGHFVNYLIKLKIPSEHSQVTAFVDDLISFI